jgi:hypothetical protein
MENIDIKTTELVADYARPRTLPRSRARVSAAWRRLVCRLTRVVPGMAIAVAVYSLFQATGMAFPPLAAMAGAAALVYLGTATLSANVMTALVDVAAAVATATLAYNASDAATLAVAFLAHALWGILRTALDADPPHGLTGNWSSFSTTIAILVLLG